MELVIIALAIWGIYEAIKAGVRKSKEKARREQMERIQREQEAQRAMLIKAQNDERERVRQITLLEREQTRQAKEQERMQKEQTRQAEVLRKHEEKIAKLEFMAYRAKEDIENINFKMSELQKYEEYLEAQRDKCNAGSAEYFKWQNKLNTVYDKCYRLEKAKCKAMFQIEQAEKASA